MENTEAPAVATTKNRISKRKKAIIITSIVVVAVLLFLFLIAPYTISIIVYESIFGARFETPEEARFTVAFFGGNLCADRYEFESLDGNTLVGYRYYTDKMPPKGVIVFSHGFGGGGHNVFMDLCWYLANNGFDVFAYDATGNDESGGKGVGGLPQGLKDICCAIDYLQQIPCLKDLPLFLCGFSWGGYCVASALSFYPQVKAIASLSGFDKASDLIYIRGKEFIGGLADFSLPYVASYERMKFGDYAKATAMDGFANSSAGVFVAHSLDDEVVPIEFGYGLYHKTYASDSRFVFKCYEDRGHAVTLARDIAFDSDGNPKEVLHLDYDLLNDIIAFFNSYL